MTIKTVVTGKNQLTIPAALARELNIEPGVEVEWEVKNDRQLVITPVISKAELLRQLQEKFKDLIIPGSDVVGDLIRERELEMNEEEPDW